MPKRIPVESSHLTAIAYDAEQKVLEIEFKDGSVYQYAEVPNYIYTGLLYAKSHGQFFHDHIKNGPYPFTKLT